MTIIFGQCNDAIRTKIALGASYEANGEGRELIEFSQEYAQFATEALM